MSLFQKLFAARTVDGGHPSSPSPWLHPTPLTAHSGERIDEYTTISSAGLYSALRLMGESAGMLPLNVMKRLEPGLEVAQAHSLQRIVHDEPNEDQTPIVWEEQIMTRMFLWGNYFAEVARGGNGRVRAIYPISPSRVEVKRRGESQNLFYTVKPVDVGGKTVEIDAKNMLHIPLLGFDGISGFGLIELARNATGLALATERYGSEYFEQGRMKGYMKHPGTFKDPKEAKRRIMEGIRESSKKHGMAVFEEGMEWIQMGVPPEEAQFLQTRNYQVLEISRYTGIPPHMLMQLDRATFTNIEQQSSEFLRYALMPKLVRIEQEINRKCISRSERRTYFVRHNMDELYRAELETRYQAHAIAIQNGVKNPNEVREEEGLNPYEGGDEYRTPTNIESEEERESKQKLAEKAAEKPVIAPPGTPGAKPPAGQVGKGTEQEKAKPRPARSELERAFVIDIGHRAVAREKTWAAKGCKREEHFYEGHARFLAAALRPVGFTKEEREMIAGTWCAYSQRQIALSDDPAALIDTWAQERPTTLAEFIFGRLEG